MAMAKAAASRSTCYRLNVGAVIVDASETTQRVVAVGYNGAPSGMPHCSGNGCQYFAPTGCKVTHAESNAIGQCLGREPGTHELYVTHSPCAACAQVVTACGLFHSVFYETAYRDSAPIKWLLAMEGLGVYQLLPSGFVVDAATGELCSL